MCNQWARPGVAGWVGTFALLAAFSWSPSRSVAAELIAPPAIPPLRALNAEPEDVRTAVAALQAVCVAWPHQAGLSRSGISMKVAEADSSACGFVIDPTGARLSTSATASMLTLLGLIPVALVLGLVRLILVAAWSWRPRFAWSRVA